MLRRILAGFFAFLVLASAASAAPEQGGGRSAEDAWTSPIAAVLDTMAGLLKAALDAIEDPGDHSVGQSEQERSNQPSDEFGTGPEPSGSATDEFGTGPEPNGSATDEFGSGPEPNG